MQTKQLIGYSLTLLLSATFITGCATRDGVSATATRSNPLDNLREAMPSIPGIPGMKKRVVDAVPAPKARRIGSDAKAEALDNSDEAIARRIDSLNNEKGLGMEDLLVDEDGLFAKRKPVDPDDGELNLSTDELPEYQLTKTDPKAKAAQLLAEAEAMGTGEENIDFGGPDLPDIEGLEALLTDVGAQVFASRAGKADGSNGDYLMSFKRNGSGTMTELGLKRSENDFDWTLAGETVTMTPRKAWSIPRKYELYSYKQGLYLLPTRHAAKLKETLREEGAIREDDLPQGFVFDAVRSTFSLADNYFGAPSGTSSKTAAGPVGGALLTPASGLSGRDKDLRDAMDTVTVGQIRWNSGVELDDTVTLLGLIWDENTNDRQPKLRLMADKKLRSVTDPVPFASRTSLTFAQILQERNAWKGNPTPRVLRILDWEVPVWPPSKRSYFSTLLVLHDSE